MGEGRGRVFIPLGSPLEKAGDPHAGRRIFNLWPRRVRIYDLQWYIYFISRNLFCYIRSFILGTPSEDTDGLVHRLLIYLIYIISLSWQYLLPDYRSIILISGKLIKFWYNPLRWSQMPGHHKSLAAILKTDMIGSKRPVGEIKTWS